MTARSRKVLLALLALGAIVPFLPALNAPFLEWDDAVNLARNPHWRGFSAVNVRWMLTTMFGGPYQPLSWLSYALDFTLWGANPAAMRATNYLLHGCSAALFFLIVEDLIKRASPSSSSRDRAAAALFAALLWAVHPLRVESVAWLTERRDVLSGFFYLLTILLYLRAPDKPLRPLISFCLAVLSKASVMTLPLTFLLLDLWPLRRRAWAEKLPYLAISAAAGLAGLAGQKAYGTLKGTQAALGVHSLWWYAAKTAWPSGLSPYHPMPEGFGPASPAVLGAGLGLALLAGAAWAARRRAPVLGFSLLHYAVALLPLAGFVRFGHHLAAERYSYLPALSLSALAGAALLAARRREALRLPANAAAAAVILLCASLAARGAGYWSGTEALWRRSLDVHPGSTYARVNLAEHLARRGGDALAARDYYGAETLLREAVALKPDFAAARYDLAGALGGLGRRAEALAELEAAARLDFDDAPILNNLGVALSAAGKHARAEAALRRAAELAPAWPAPRHNLGNALKAQGRGREAAAAYADAERLAGVKE